MSFIHLQVRSGYSFLESTNTVDKLVEKASELQFNALALTDEEVLYGTIPFYKACIKHGIKPIIGMTVNVINIEEESEQCVLLAKDNDGYQQLATLSSEIKKSKQTGMEIERIRSFTSNLICILPVHKSKLGPLLNELSHEAAEVYVNEWQSLFNKEDFYLGIADHGLTSEQNLHQSIKAFHDTIGVPVVAVNDVRYLNEKDDIAYDCLQAIKDGKGWTIRSSDQILSQHHLRSTEEMERLFSSFWPKVLEETKAIAEKCNVTFDFNAIHMPSFPVPEEQDAHTYLEQLCWQNTNEKFDPITKEMSDRLTYELHVIKSMKFSDYFLIVADYIDYSKENGILVGPGRGSAAGSMVAYVLGITDVDPLKYELLFERFLNPERVSMPDIDVDFSDSRRDEVIDYVRNKYGEEHVAQIITFGTFGARSLLRELFKTMEIDPQDTHFILDKIPAQANKPIAMYVKESQDLIDYIKQSNKLRTLFTIATKLEGLPRHLSTHAAGIVISQKPLIDHIPLTIGANGTNLTQFPMNDLESIGLLKMDFLGLRNLTFLERIIQSITFSTNKTLTLNNIPEHDIKTYELLQKGHTNGVFQLESQGMKQVLVRLKPTSFEDLVAVNALYRPGPMDNIPTYISRKHQKEKVSYLHPDLAPILGKTYGVLIYQEQIMQIAHKIAGFTLGEADLLRGAISNKSIEEMTQQKDAFINGCLKNGYEQAIADEIFLWIVKFSSYGFNRSHAVAYSKISYQLAYLKAHYQGHFFAELLGSVANQEDKVTQYIKEAKDLNLKVLPPSINKSFGRYSVEKKSIRMGLLAIKGIGHQIVNEILLTRKDRPFTSLFDFCLRVPLKTVNRKTLELLIISGAFDETYSNRASLLASIDQAIDQGELFGGLANQPSLLPNKFGIKEIYTEIEDFSQMKKLSDEKELLGVYISSHPLKEYRKKLQVNGYTSFNNIESLVGKRNISGVAIIQSIKKIRTKRGDPMAFITIGDEYGNMDAVVFPELYRNENRWLKEEKMIFITGKIEERNNRTQWLLSEIKPFEESVLNISTHRLFIKLTEPSSDQALTVIKDIATKHPGNIPIIIYHEERKSTYKLSSDYNVNASDICLKLMVDYFGKTSVVLEK